MWQSRKTKERAQIEAGQVSIRPVEVRLGVSVSDLRVPPLFEETLALHGESGNRQIVYMPAANWRKARSAEGCLDAFLGLREVQDGDIFDFVKKWSVLCIHPELKPFPEAEMGDALWHYEPTDVYRYYALNAWTILRIEAALRNNEPVPLKEWGMIFTPNSPDTYRWPDALQPKPDRDTQKTILSSAIDRWWIQPARIYPVIRWDAGNPFPILSLTGTDTGQFMQTRKDFSDFMNQLHALDALDWQLGVAQRRYAEGPKPEVPGHLFKVLAIQLAAAVVSPGGRQFCGICGKPITDNQRLVPSRRGASEYLPLCKSERCHWQRNRDTRLKRKQSA